MSISKEYINNLLNESDKLQTEFNEKILNELLISINSKFKLNIEQRKKNINDYNKYLPLEESLNEDITVLQRLGAYPLLIPFFIKIKGIETIIKLLSHPNTDLINTVVNLIEEITEGDFLNELEDPKSFLELFLSNNLFDALVSNLYKISNESSEENQYIMDILSIIENFIEIYPPSPELIGQNTKILNWLMITLKNISYNDTKDDDIKVFCSEILYSLLQNSTKNQIKFAKMEGLPHLINLIISIKENSIKGNNFKGGNNEEYINNIINCICSSLFEEGNQDIFNKADGISIMIDCMRDNNIFRHLGIKVLNFALMDNKENCRQFVEMNGLGVLFSYFMGKGFKKYTNGSHFKKGEKYCIEIILNLFKFLDGVNRERLIYKFKENKYEKIERLINYFFKNCNGNKNDEDDNWKYIKEIICVVILCIKKEGKDVEQKVNEICDGNKIDIKLDIVEVVKGILVKLGGSEKDENKGESFEYISFLNKLI